LMHCLVVKHREQSDTSCFMKVEEEIR